jgi:putative hydrolase of the HAD superfamily
MDSAMTNRSDTNAGAPGTQLPENLKALIFDVDGTLYRLRGVQRAVQLHFLRAYWHRPVELWRVALAVRSFRQAADALRSAPAHDAELYETQIEVAAGSSGLAKEFIRSCVHRWMMQEPLAYLLRFRFEGIREILAEMRNLGLRLGVFSDYPAAAKLRALEIEEFFDVVVAAQDPQVQRFKPDPRGLQIILERMGIRASQAMYVGDRPGIDDVTAQRAGAACILLGDGETNSPKTFWELREVVRAAMRKNSS